MKLPHLRLACLTLLPSLAHGGLISITTTALDTTGANIGNDGPLLLAWDVNGGTGFAPVVNGIPFTTTTPASVTAAGFPAVVDEGVGGATTLTKAHYTDDLAEVIGDYVGTNANANGTVTVDGLTPGTTYRVQFLQHQDINNNATRQMEVRFGGATGTSSGVISVGDEVGYITTVIFSADATSQLFTFDPGSDDRAILNAMVVHESSVSLGINSPVSRQVIQRDATNTADIPITGQCTGSPGSIEARAVVMSGTGNNGTTTPWTTIDTTLPGGAFSGTLNDVPAGGWYQIEVRPVIGGTPGASSAITRIGVGDVYLTCGQSNAANRGTPAYSPNIDRFSALHYSTGAWSLAADPMPGPSTGSSPYTGTPWSRLGEMLVTRDQVPVALVCFAESGSNVTRWLPANNDLYPRIRTAVQRFPANGFKGILWHQGETNAQTSVATNAATYQTWLQTVIAQSRTDAGWTVPWYIAEASRIGAGLATEEPVVAGQRATIFADPQVFAGPVTDNYHQEGKISADGVHFNDAGLTDHAAQWAEILGGTPPLSPKNPDFETNTALADGGIGTINNTATTSPCVNGWRALNAANDGAADGCGYYNPNASFYANSSDGGANGGVLPGMSGKHVAFLSNSPANSCFLQTRRALLKPGQTYTLTVAIGVRDNANVFGGATVELLADGNVLASRTIDRAALDALNAGNAAGTFTDIALTHTTGQAVTPGQPLAIRIRKPGGANTYLDFDNVRLTSAATPYTSWQIEHFGSAAIASAAWEADPDGDSLANGIEYHLGLEPEVRDSSEFLSLLNRDGKSWVRYGVPLDSSVDPATLGLWYSLDLAAWQPAADHPDGTIIDSREADAWSLEISSTDHPRAFFQLRAGPPPP